MFHIIFQNIVNHTHGKTIAPEIKSQEEERITYFGRGSWLFEQKHGGKDGFVNARTMPSYYLHILEISPLQSSQSSC